MLRIYAKARLLDGLANNDIVTASSDVQQLARLLVSSELLIAAMVGTSMLSMERSLYDAELAKGHVVSADWHPLSADDIRLLRRVAAAGFEYTEIEAPTKIAHVIDGSVPLDCIALHENVIGALELRPVAQDTYVDSYACFDALVANKDRCRFTAVRAAWQEPDARFDAAKLACRPTDRTRPASSTC